jgi:hypothetical protein
MPEGGKMALATKQTLKKKFTITNVYIFMFPRGLGGHTVSSNIIACR